MKRLCGILALSFLCITSSLTAQEKYKMAWDALNNNDRVKAAALLAESAGDPLYGTDSYITNIYLQYYNGRDKNITDFESSFYNKVSNPYPYVFALWFNNAVLGAYGKKTLPHQLQLLERIIKDPKAPGTLSAAAHYQKGVHLLYSNKLEESRKEYASVTHITDWQYAGPFENLSESGLYKDYGPLLHPEAEAVFTSSTRAPVRWFAPAVEDKQGWTPLCYNINRRTAVAYAQTFVQSAADQEVYLNAGFTGAMRLWLNDEAIFADYKERITELDAYTIKCTLKKGVNRILVQIGYTDNSYPNFSIRLTDDRYYALPGLQGSSIYQPYQKASAASGSRLIPHLAEAFFQQKIAADSANLVNYMLLSDVYMRNKKTLEARNLMESAIKRAPGNNLLRVKLIDILNKENNRTTVGEEVEKIKSSDPESLFALELSIKDAIANEKLESAAEFVSKREALYGEDESTISNKLVLLSKEKKFDDLVKAGEDAFKKYPEESAFLEMIYAIQKEVYKDNKAALKVYDDFLKENFVYETMMKYSQLLQENGQADKSLQIKMQLTKDFPFDPAGLSIIANHYYTTKQYDKAEEFTKKALQLSPYNETYWELLGDIKSETKQTAEAIKAYDESLLYDPNQYTVINKIRKLKGKQESYKLLPETDIDALIKNDRPEEAKNTDYGFYYLCDEKNVIMHPGGATEEYDLFIVRITNEKGIDRYKESSIGYGGSQTLLIEKAEILKASGARVQGERNDNEIVFTNLGIGDVIIFKYRIQNFVYGRFAPEFWDKYYFSGQIYTAIRRYNLLLPGNQQVNYVFTNSPLQPTISEVDGFKKYSWVLDKAEPLKEEPLMPNNCDIGSMLHISTIPHWKDISSWYADIVNNRTEEDYEITALYNQLFPAGKATSMSQFARAKKIYNYIEKNIRYSSVSFRQGAYVPQRASTTLNTKLGDCKDLSSLFVTLCRMADIKCRMVLVDTRDNGARDIVLPSVEFNHCIVKAQLDNKDYFIELTDNNLPFTCLPNNLIGAAILEIPDKVNPATPDLAYLTTANRPKDHIKRVMSIKPDGNNLVMDVTCIKYGVFSGNVRQNFANLDPDKQLTEMQGMVASSYKNNVKVEQLRFSDLKELSDSATYTYRAKVKDEISEIGSLQTFRVTYPDVIATLDNFSLDTRTYPIEYTNYENADSYETLVTIEAPAGKKFVELPKNELLRFGNMTFSLSYRLVTPGKLVISRKFISDRKRVPAEEYVAFKTFFEKIVKAEQKMLAFK